MSVQGNWLLRAFSPCSVTLWFGRLHQLGGSSSGRGGKTMVLDRALVTATFSRFKL